MKTRTLFFLILTLLVGNKLFAQCTFTVGVSSTESRCRESGTISINPSPTGQPYIYEIISGPVTTAPGSSNVFVNLPAGNYVVSTTLSGCIVSTPITVTGNYQEPGLLLATAGNIACPDGTACIAANQPTNGRLPYSYSIIAGPTTRPSQSSPVFCNIPGGDYTIQAFDSCGIVRTTTIRVAYDTGDFYAYTYGYNLEHINCTDLKVCPMTGFTGTSSHSLMRVWYVTPSGDTLKVNNFEYPVRCDTLVGYSHSYGNWQMLAYDSCGRIRKSSFTFNAPGLNIGAIGPVCGGFQVQIGNSWKYNVPVGYDVYKCSDNSLVYSYTPPIPAGWFSEPITLEYDTCYYFVHYNNCGDTLRRTYTAPAAPTFNINGCDGPACSDAGKGTLTLWQTYLSGSGPITFTILSGPERVGVSIVQPANSSYVSFQNMLLGTYTVAAVDACGIRDTISVTLDEPLIRTIEITQQKNCSGGANVHLKITSNFYVCAPGFTTIPGASTFVSTTSPGYTPVNIISVARTSTSPSVWEADYLSVTAASVLFRIHSTNGCDYDTAVIIDNYVAPVLNNIIGFICTSTNIAAINTTQTGGVAPYVYRVRSSSGGAWTTWQNNTVFASMNTGAYEIEVRDGCPNGSISSFNVSPWSASPISVNNPCAAPGSTVEFSANPAVAGVSYEWVRDGVVIGTGPRLSISNFQTTNGGTYYLRQVFPGNSCIDSTRIDYVSCLLLPLKMEALSGSRMGKSVSLQWKSTLEEAGAYFEIEKSNNGHTFELLQTVPVKNIVSGTLYSAKDNMANEPSSYYRIKYIGANGKYFYSNIININFQDLQKRKISIHPNPFNTDMNISFISSRQNTVRIKMFDMSGKMVMNRVYASTPGLNRINIGSDILGNLNAGVYTVEVVTSEESIRQKVIKQK